MDRTRVALPISLALFAVLAFALPASAKTEGSLADLVVQKISNPPRTNAVGTKVKVVVKVANKGDARAGKSKLGLYLGKGRKHTKKDRRLKRVKVKPLAGGKAKKVKVQVVLPAKAKLGSYRLFACADDTKKVKEAKERNCKSTRKILLVKGNTALPTAPPPAAAFSMSDGIDWGFLSNAQGNILEPGDPVTMTLTAGNGIPGQAGYSRAGVAGEGFRGGTTTTLDFGSALDDGQVTLALPFDFPFGGIEERSISVSTNGWVSFGSPAWDYWDHSQPNDYRGIQALVGEVDRGLMPYWADLDLKDEGSGAGTVKQVVAPDGSWVAFQWDIGQQNAGGAPRRSFQLVLFPDGSFRFDYPGANGPGGNRAFVGYSLGTGAASADVVSAQGTAVPTSSLLFTPNALPAISATSTGDATAILPKGSSFLFADPGCSLSVAPGPFGIGQVVCSMPALGVGDQASRAVSFSMPNDAPGQHGPANFRLHGVYSSGDLRLTDEDEIDGLSRQLEPSTLDIDPEYTGGNIEAGVPTTFQVTFASTPSGLDEPTVTFAITNSTISKVEIDGEPIECVLGTASAACVLPSGASSAVVDLTFVPTEVGSILLETSARALNAPEVSVNAGVFP